MISILGLSSFHPVTSPAQIRASPLCFLCLAACVFSNAATSTWLVSWTSAGEPIVWSTSPPVAVTFHIVANGEVLALVPFISLVYFLLLLGWFGGVGDRMGICSFGVRSFRRFFCGVLGIVQFVSDGVESEQARWEQSGWCSLGRFCVAPMNGNDGFGGHDRGFAGAKAVALGAWTWWAIHLWGAGGAQGECRSATGR